MYLPGPAEQVDDPARHRPHLRRGLGVEPALDVLEQPVVLGDAGLDVPAGAQQPLGDLALPVVRADVAPRRVEQLGEHRRHPDARPFRLGGGARGRVEPAVVELALQDVGERAVGVLEVDVEPVQEQRHRLVTRDEDRPVLGLAQRQQPEAVGLPARGLAWRAEVGEAVGEAALLVGVVEQSAHDRLGDVAGLVGPVRRHPGGEAGELVDHVVEGGLAGEPHRSDDDVHRGEREQPQVVLVVVDAGVGGVADQPRHRVGQRQRPPPVACGRVGGGRDHAPVRTRHVPRRLFGPAAPRPAAPNGG
ncbi:hypothetical protein ACFQV8_14620 [Pseudonocardia benzenivorans]